MVFSSDKLCYKSAALVLRLVIGAIFLYSGIVKLMDVPMMIGFFASVGLSAVIFWLVAIGEVFAGAALILGIFTRIASAIVVIIMTGATIIMTKATGFASALPTLVYGFIGVSLFLTGPGKFALAHKFSKCECAGACDGCKDGSCETK